MLKPRAIFFDLDETLIENSLSIKQLFSKVHQNLNHELIKQEITSVPLNSDQQALFAKAFSHQASQLWANMFTRTESPEAQFIDCFAQSIRAANHDHINEQHTEHLATQMFEKFIHISSNNIQFNNGALETLAALKQAGFITGIITNGIEQLQQSKIDQLELHKHVDHVVISAQARAHKPHNQVFSHALNKAQVSPQQAWLVGDHATNDVAGAIRAGMTGLFYDPSGERRDTAFAELDERPNYVITHLNEVLALAQHE